MKPFTKPLPVYSILRHEPDLEAGAMLWYVQYLSSRPHMQIFYEVGPTIMMSSRRGSQLGYVGQPFSPCNCCPRENINDPSRFVRRYRKIPLPVQELLDLDAMFRVYENGACDDSPPPCRCLRTARRFSYLHTVYRPTYLPYLPSQ